MDGKNIKEAAGTRIEETGRKIVKDVIKRGNQYVQEGRSKKKKSIKGGCGCKFIKASKKRKLSRTFLKK